MSDAMQEAAASRILIADDEKSIRFTLGIFLHEAGYETVQVECVEEAFECLSAGGVDVVLTDIWLSGRSGVDLLRDIRAMGSRLPVILMTGEPSLATASEAIRSNVFAYLEKPVSKDVLLRTVADALLEKERLDEHEWLLDQNRLHTEDLEGQVKERTTRWLRSEARSWETLQIMKGILDHMHVLAAYLDPQLNVVWVNPALAATEGHGVEFFVGKNLFDLYPDAENRALFKKVVDTGQGFRAKATSFLYPRHAERGVTYWDWTLTPTKNSDGTVTGLALTLVDVTEREEMRKALERCGARQNQVCEDALQQQRCTDGSGAS